MIATAFDRAMQAGDHLAPEDVSLFLRTLLERIPIEACPSLFAERPVEDVERLVLWLVLGFDPVDQAGMVDVLVEKIVDREEPQALAGLVRLGQWIEACLGSARA